MIDPLDPKSVNHPCIEIVSVPASRGQQEMALCVSKALLDSVFVGKDSIKYALENCIYKFSPPGTRLIAKPLRSMMNGKVQLYPQLCEYYEIPEHLPGCGALRHPEYGERQANRKAAWEAKGFSFVAGTECTTDPGCTCIRSQDQLQMSGSQLTAETRDEWRRRAKIVIKESSGGSEGVMKCDAPEENVAFIQFYRDVLGYTLRDIMESGLIWSYHPTFSAAKLVGKSNTNYPSGVARQWMMGKADESRKQSELLQNPAAVMGQMDRLVPSDQGVGGRARVEASINESAPSGTNQGHIVVPAGDSEVIAASEELLKAMRDMSALKKRKRGST